jgi:lysophospholipase L1-like esterase
LTSLVVLCAVAVPLAVRADISNIDQTGARPTEQAIRLGSSCERVWVVGDSLTVGSDAALRSGLSRLGVDYVVDGVNGRRVSVNALPTSRSGVLAARSIRAASGESDCWVVALGTNDINSGVTTPVRARATIAEMLAEIPTPARVWWVNVEFRSIEGAGVDYPAATQTFNAALAQRDASDARFRVIDWYSLAQSHPEWFADAVHVTPTGYAARGELIVDSLRRSSER